MVSRLTNWIIGKIALGEFTRRRDVLRFAMVRTLYTALGAVVVNFGLYQLLGSIPALGITVPPNLVTDAIVTALVAASISFFAYCIVGLAIVDLSISRKEFERLSRTDTLTGLLNRKTFDESIETLGRPYVLVLIDVDRFKSINDSHGHSVGDEVLVTLARMLQALEQAHAVARIGGEEFAAVLPEVDKDEAVRRIDELRRQMSSELFRVNGAEFQVTFSAGLAQSDAVTGYSTLLSQADKAMYLAKASGRDRIVHSDDIAGLFPVLEPYRKAI